MKQEALDRLRDRIRERLAEQRSRQERRRPEPPPRYDEVYLRGVAWLHMLDRGEETP